MKVFMKNIQTFLNLDIENIWINFWKNISSVSKRSFLLVFILTNLIFLWHTISFIPDNHSLQLIKEGINWNFQYSDHIGRFTGGWIQQIFNGELLPIIQHLFCYAGLTLTTIYIANYWQLPKTVFCYTLFGLFMTLIPFNLPWIYFMRHNTYFWNLFLMVYGLMLLEKKHIIPFVFACVFFVLSLGAIVSIIQPLLIIFLGKCLIDSLFHNYTIKSLFFKVLNTGLCVFVSLIIFVLIEWYLSRIGMLGSHSQTRLLIPDLLRIKVIITAFVKDLPYLSSTFRFMILLPVILVFFYAYFKNTYFSVLLIIAILIASQLTFLFAAINFTNTVRVCFFSYPWLSFLFLGILLKINNLFKNIAILIMGIGIYYSALQDLKWEKSFVLESKEEILLYHDITREIKKHPNFRSDKKYVLIMLGELSTKGTFNREYREWNGENHFINSNLNPFWQPYQMLNFFENEFYIKDSYSSAWKVFRQLKPEVIKKLDQNFLLNQAKPYPNSNFIHVDDNYIYIIFNEKMLNTLKNKILEIGKD